jgi:hypothetical protein
MKPAILCNKYTLIKMEKKYGWGKRPVILAI